MRTDSRKSSLAVRAALLGALVVAGPARAQHDHAAHAAPVPPAASHGGTLVEAGGGHFEVVFTTGGLTVYPMTAAHQPVDASRLTGTATFFHPAQPGKPWFERALQPVAPGTGQAAAALGLTADLSKVPPSGATVSFRVEGLGQPAQFTTPFALAGSGALTVAAATAADRAAIAAQRDCRVSGEALGSMGVPLKVSRGGQATFVCCKGCLKAVQAAPEKFLSAAGTAAPAAGHGPHDH